ncbi:hypothetical protein GQ53DRAFT_847968, partial [Thozetella sp. PMI_491]
KASFIRSSSLALSLSGQTSRYQAFPPFQQQQQQQQFSRPNIHHASQEIFAAQVGRQGQGQGQGQGGGAWRRSEGCSPGAPAQGSSL